MSHNRSAAAVPASRLVACDGPVLHVRIWPGDPRRTVVLWHGITGTSVDHVALAERLCRLGHQVVAPDSLGCGASDWASDAEHGYGLGALARVGRAMLDALGIGRVAWFGASKGGGLGIRMAAETPERIATLVLCDVGPGLPMPFRQALAPRLAHPPTYPDMAGFRAHVARLLERERLVLAPARIDRLAIAWSRRLGPAVGYHYDPALANQLHNNPEDFDLWPQWDSLSCPILVLRGEHSPVLTSAELDAMLERNHNARGMPLVGSGHLNFLDDPAQQDAVIAFLTDGGR